MIDDGTRWSIRRRDAIETSVFLIAAVVGLVAAIWLPPALFHTSQRVVSLRLALLSVTAGAVVGLVIAAVTLVRHVHVEPPRSPSAEPAFVDTRAT